MKATISVLVVASIATVGVWSAWRGLREEAKCRAFEKRLLLASERQALDIRPQDSSEMRSTIGAMARTDLYWELRRKRETFGRAQDEVFVEGGNYAWGGYSAILAMRKPGLAKVYLCHVDHGAIQEAEIAPEAFAGFCHELSRRGIWVIEDAEGGVDDASGHVITIREGKRERRTAVYAAAFLEDTMHRKIIAYAFSFGADVIGRNSQHPASADGVPR
jgi:hypothetical protein